MKTIIQIIESNIFITEQIETVHTEVIATFIEATESEAFSKAQNFIDGQSTIRFYLAQSGEVYPQYKIIKHPLRGQNERIKKL